MAKTISVDCKGGISLGQIVIHTPLLKSQLKVNTIQRGNYLFIARVYKQINWDEKQIIWSVKKMF